MTAIPDLLRVRYPAKTHVLLFEVRDGAGFNATRSCDAIAISTWPSRGLDLVGFEIKESRADWLREYRNPEKAETFQAMCDRWYLVAAEGDGKIVQPDELPETWGLLVRRGNRLVCEKGAPRRAAPAHIDNSFLAAMLKNARDAAATPVRAEYQRGYEDGKKAQAGYNQTERDHWRAQVERYEQAIDTFQTASGVKINTWDAPKIGEAVRLVLDGGHLRHLDRLRHMLPQARELVTALERLAAQGDSGAQA